MKKWAIIFGILGLIILGVSWSVSNDKKTSKPGTPSTNTTGNDKNAEKDQNMTIYSSKEGRFNWKSKGITIRFISCRKMSCSAVSWLRAG